MLHLYSSLLTTCMGGNEQHGLRDIIDHFAKFKKDITSEYKYNFLLKIYLNQCEKKIKNFSSQKTFMYDVEFYDATLIFTYLDKRIECPIEINIDKLQQLISRRHKKTCDTRNIYKYISKDTIQEYNPNIKGREKGFPVLVLFDNNFEPQIIDGNHKVIRSYINKQHYTEYVHITTRDLYQCFENPAYKFVIKMFRMTAALIGKKYLWR